MGADVGVRLEKVEEALHAGFLVSLNRHDDSLAGALAGGSPAFGKKGVVENEEFSGGIWKGFWHVERLGGKSSQRPRIILGELNKFGYQVYSNGSSIFVNTNNMITSLTVTSIDGKIVFNKTNINRNQQIDLNSSNGIYLVNIQTSQGVFSEKVLLK